jgi:phenylpyruvate tautomerase PptA (4-oxalocrotonate tautomerase family)
VGPDDQPAPATADLADPVYLTILFSVFASTITGDALAECLRVGADPDSFATFVHEQFPALDRDLITRIAAVVAQTYRFRYSAAELDQRRLRAPITVIRARGDTPSFLEDSPWHYPHRVTVIDLAADHYNTLKDHAIEELVAAIHRTPRARSETVMPHVNIKHFPTPLTDDQQVRLVSALTAAVQNAFDCDEGVISIALEPVEQEVWHERVYLPEIVNRKQLLHKVPNY